jgi:hypothetical protein
MQLAGATECAIIVSRWLGGITLHGDRFWMINNKVLSVRRANGFFPAQAAAPPGSPKQKKNGRKKR